MLRIDELIWDEWNTEHIKKHGVAREEVEEVCYSQFHISRSKAKTYRIVGQSLDGRYLTVILARRNTNKFYPVTARSASNSETKLFKKWQKG